MNDVVIRATGEQIAAYQKQDPLFCEFLVKTGRVVQKDEQKVTSNEQLKRLKN